MKQFSEFLERINHYQLSPAPQNGGACAGSKAALVAANDISLSDGDWFGLTKAC
jgi:hypothetical protein